MTLLELPPEILVNIYCNLANVNEATQLAQTCSALNAILKQSFNHRKIFQSIISDKNIREENSNVRGKSSFQVVYYYYLPSLNVQTGLDKICRGLLPDWSISDNIPDPVSIFEFLAQFDDIESCSLVDTVIIKSARYQSRLLKAGGSIFLGSNTIIARTLLCFVILSKVAHALHRKHEEGTISQYFVQSSEQDEPIHKLHHGEFSHQIESILSDLESMIKRGTAKVWPIILTVLCLFSWMSVEFDREEYDLQVLDDLEPNLSDPFSNLTAPLLRLSKMFYVQMRGNHPFQSLWNRAAFLELSHEDLLARAHFDMLNQSWHIASRSILVHHRSLPSLKIP